MTGQLRFAGAELRPGSGPVGAPRTRDLGGGVRAGSLLDLLPELGDGLAAEEWRAARAKALVQLEAFPAGAWTPHITRRPSRPATGLLITAGLLVREVEIAGRAFAELLGVGDLIYPWAPRTEASLPAGKWRALSPGTLAVVDELLIARVSPYPSIAMGLARLSTLRGRFLASLTITRRLRRVEERLMFLFALLAERWGRVTPDGIVIALPLNHELLARLIGTRRQAVTTALGALRERALVRPLADGGWLLAREHSASYALVPSARPRSRA
jgi:CRP/FNR family transcriptional regulator, cyclic AMP receptor protein